MTNWYLYVLRYNYSGNYYVGITTKLKDRMDIHRKLKPTKHNLPKWSNLNESRKGFTYYWFEIDCDNISHSIASHCENTFTREIHKEIEKFEDNKLNRKIYIYGGDLTKPPYPNVEQIEKNTLDEDERYEKINAYLTHIEGSKLETKKGEYSITFIK